MDAEIAAASNAALRFWAYCWYGIDSSMQQAWRFHQASQLKERVNWCAIFSSLNLLRRETQTRREFWIDSFKDTNYQKVLSRRPLCFVLVGTNESAAEVSAAMSDFRQSLSPLGVAPYMVVLGTTPPADQLGADATGFYAFAPPKMHGRYPDLAASVEAQWSTLAAHGGSVVPTAMTGWDRRPRVEHPVPWEAYRQKPHAGFDFYYNPGSPAEVGAHVRAMIDWLNRNPSVSPARTGLIYSWDEYDEGGTTLGPDLGRGDSVLKAVGNAIKSGRAS